MYFNPIIAMIHNTATDRYHPVIFSESPLPGPDEPEKLVRHKSAGHHTVGFDTREGALANIESDLAPRMKQHAIGDVRTSLAKDFPWDGEGVPAMVAFFAQVGNELEPAIW